MEVRGRAGEGVVYAAGSVEATAEGAKAAIRKFSRNVCCTKGVEFGVRVEGEAGVELKPGRPKVEAGTITKFGEAIRVPEQDAWKGG